MVVFGKNWLYSVKTGFNRAKVVVFGQKWLCSGNWLYLVKSGSVWEKGSYFDKVVFFQAK